MNFIQGLFPKKDDATKVEINLDSKIRALAFLPEERPRIVSCEENMVQIRDLRDNFMGEQIESKTGVLAVAVSKEGHRIVTGAADGFTIWNMSEGDPVEVVHHAINGVRTIDISSDSEWVITGSDARTADVWNLSTGERHPNLGPFRHEYNVVAVKLCPCRRRLATGTLFGSVRIFATDFVTNPSAKKLITVPITAMSTPTSSNISLAWFADAKRPTLFAVAQGQIKCLDPIDGCVIYQWALRGITHPASLVISPNRQLIAYSLNDTVVVRDLATGQQVGDTLEHNGNVSSISFSSQNGYLAAAGDTHFTVWDLRRLAAGTSESYFVEPTMEHAESCAHRKQDTEPKGPPTTFLLPLLNICNPAVKPWLHSYLDDAEEVLSNETKKPESVSDHNLFANRALVRGRSKRYSLALEDANQSLLIRKSAIGQVAKAIAVLYLGDREAVQQEVSKILETGHSDEHTSLLRVIQSILLCFSGDHDKEISNIETLSGDRKLLFLVQANIHLAKEKFEDATQSFKKARVPTIFPYDETPEMRTLLFIFGWKFSGLGIQVQQKKCEFLLNRQEPESAGLYLEVKDTYKREIATHAELSGWALEFGKRCLDKLRKLGDGAIESRDYEKAIRYYKAVEPLIAVPEWKFDLLLKRSDAYTKLDPQDWKAALRDADDAIRIDPYSPWGYDKRHEALSICKDYSSAAEALDQVIKNLADSKDAKSIEYRNRGVAPRKTRKIVLDVVDDILARPRPHELIDTITGRLCNKEKQTEAFRAGRMYKELILSPTSDVIRETKWKEDIQRYFCYSTLSHTWEDNGEPKFQEVNGTGVDTLPDSFPNNKLKMFRKKTYDHGYLWAWSDTCCINKDEREILDVALRSMYRWYSESSLTIVHLKGVLRHLEIDVDILLDTLDQLLEEFVKCRWNTRAWTLQEYFASKVIHFYTEEWKPYLPINVPGPSLDTEIVDHKRSRAIERGMERVTGLSAERLVALQPGSEDAREKLRLASVRKATKREDVAYSLLGIFKVTIEAVYGDDEVPRALGRLLGALLTQSADVAILAWTGKSSEYNTCLPAEITVYQESEYEYISRPIKETEQAVSVLNNLSSAKVLESAVKLHDRLLDLPPPELHHGRLKLPCICFPLSPISQNVNSGKYVATSKLLSETVEIKAAEDVSFSRTMVLVHPWFRGLLEPSISLKDSIRHRSASKLITSLRQEFGALLLTLNQASQDYRRVAADQHIRVKIRDNISPDELLENVRVLYIR